MAGGHEIKQKLSKEMSVPLTAQSFIVPKSSLQVRVPRIINGSKVDLKTLFRMRWRHNWPVMLNN